MSNKNILFIDHAEAIGGAEKSLLMLMKSLRDYNWKPHLATVQGDLAELAFANDIPVHFLDFPRLRRSIKAYQYLNNATNILKNVLQEAEIGLLYANTVRAAIYTAFAAKRTRKPFIWHMRDFWLTESKPNRLWADKKIKQFLCGSATVVVTNSQSVANHLPCLKKSRVVHNGIDVDYFNTVAISNSFRETYAIPADAPLIGMVGRLRPWKGQIPFLEMAQMVAATRPSTMFAIIGGATFGVEDDYENHLKQKTAELGISQKVIFTGGLRDVRPALKAMDVFVHPGEPEPFGLVNIEAMAMRKPVVAFAHGALPEIIIPDITGTLVPPHNVANLAKSVCSLLDNPKRMKAWGLNGRHRVETHFSIQHTSKKINKILLKVTG